MLMYLLLRLLMRAAIGGGDDGNATNITIAGNAKVAEPLQLRLVPAIGGGDVGSGKQHHALPTMPM